VAAKEAAADPRTGVGARPQGQRQERDSGASHCKSTGPGSNGGRVEEEGAVLRPLIAVYLYLELRRAEGIRRRVHGNYLIFYRIRTDMVEILHVIYGARDYAQIVFANDETEWRSQ
jgi:hypothetical protein